MIPRTGLYVLCGDDARFFNHSEDPNCFDFYSDEEQDLTAARRDIRTGEELTCDYALFDLDLIEGKYEFPSTKSVPAIRSAAEFSEMNGNRNKNVRSNR